MSTRGAQLLVFGTSAAVLVLEILAGRLMAPYVGVSIETFTGIIGTILAGIALGNYVGGVTADRVPPARLIGPTLVVGGLLAWASLPIVSLAGPSSSAQPAAIVMLAGLSFFAPAAVLSAVSPMAAKLVVRDLAETGTVVGGLSGAGTLGALVGTFLTGFVLISTVPTRPIVVVVGAALILAGIALGWRLGAGRPPLHLGAAVLVGGVLLAGALAADDRCDFETAYACGEVRLDPTNPAQRLLVLNRSSHATVDVEDPTYLGFRYTRLIAVVVDALRPGPIDALHVGGGGFTLPRYIDATRPGSSNVVFEIDGDLVAVAEEQLGLQRTPNLRIEIGDARLAITDESDASADVIVGDAFTGASVPWHLTTREFVSELARVLRSDGVYVMNVIDGFDNRFARAATATLAEQFAHVRVIVPWNGYDDQARNQILVASDSPLPRWVLDANEGRLVSDLDGYIDGQSALRDDFAPADQLAHR